MSRTHAFSPRRETDGAGSLEDRHALSNLDPSLRAYAVLTYQEYSHQNHAESLEGLLSSAFGTHGGNHA